MRIVNALPPDQQHGTCQRCSRAVFAREYVASLPPDPGRFTCRECVTPEEAEQLGALIAERARKANEGERGDPALLADRRNRAIVSSFEKARSEHARAHKAKPAPKTSPTSTATYRDPPTSTETPAPKGKSK